ncbi:MAG: peptidylprolyl isomerase [Phormidesmis sp.]
MPNRSFFFVNDESISQEQVLNYLQAAGQLDDFIETILGQHAIAQHFQTHPELLPSEETVEQRLKDFREIQSLSDPAVFDVWLQQNDITLEGLSDRLQREWSMQQLVQHISRPRLHEHFIRRKLQLDQIVLSCIAVQEEILASELHNQIKDGVPFEELAQRYSLADTAKNDGQLSPVSRKSLSDDLRGGLEAAQVGELVGPIAMEGHWCLFRLEKVLPAALEGEVKAQLQNELFQAWLDEQIAAMTVKMEVTQWLYL